jgi:excisionase family DNA binding protein
MSKTPSDLVSTTMAAQILGFTPDYIRNMIRKGRIKGFKLGHDWLIPRKALANIERTRKKRSD